MFTYISHYYYSLMLYNQAFIKCVMDVYHTTINCKTVYDFTTTFFYLFSHTYFVPTLYILKSKQNRFNVFPIMHKL